MLPCWQGWQTATKGAQEQVQHPSGAVARCCTHPLPIQPSARKPVPAAGATGGAALEGPTYAGHWAQKHAWQGAHNPEKPK